MVIGRPAWGGCGFQWFWCGFVWFPVVSTVFLNIHREKKNWRIITKIDETIENHRKPYEKHCKPYGDWPARLRRLWFSMVLVWPTTFLQLTNCRIHPESLLWKFDLRNTQLSHTAHFLTSIWQQSRKCPTHIVGPTLHYWNSLFFYAEPRQCSKCPLA